MFDEGKAARVQAGTSPEISWSVRLQDFKSGFILKSLAY